MFRTFHVITFFGGLLSLLTGLVFLATRALGLAPFIPVIFDWSFLAAGFCLTSCGLCALTARFLVFRRFKAARILLLAAAVTGLSLFLLSVSLFSLFFFGIFLLAYRFASSVADGTRPK